MTHKRLSAIVATIFLFAHIALIPFVLFFPQRMTLANKYDVLLLIGPMTAAYFVTLTQYVVDNRDKMRDTSGAASGLFIMFAIVLTVCFFLGTYGSIYLAEHGVEGFKPEDVKVPISIVEIFIGGAFALVFKSLFQKVTQETG